MEKGYIPEKSSNHVRIDYRPMLHQAIQDGQEGLISFEDVRAVFLALASSTLGTSKERQSLFEQTELSSPEKSSVNN